MLEAEALKPLVDPGEERSARVRADLPIQPVAYLDRKVRAVPDLAEIWRLHQSVHVVRAAPRIPRQLREGAGGSRCARAGTCWRPWIS